MKKFNRSLRVLRAVWFIPVLLMFLLAGNVSFAQDYKARAMHNVKYLIKDAYLNDYVKLDDTGVTIYDPKDDRKAEIKIFWNEAEFFLKMLYNTPYHEMLKIYESKGTRPFNQSVVDRYGHLTIPNKTVFSGLKVAIDPGHFANTWKQALQEEKYVKVRGKDLKQKKDVEFYESELNYTVAEVLKRMLENEGAIVYFSRSQGESAVGMPFDEWYEKRMEQDLKRSIELGDIEPGRAAYLMKQASRPEVFHTYYKFLDFVGRSRKINTFNPDVTLIIHFNSEERNERDKEGYLKPVKTNYSMIFVPGSFVRGELRKLDTRIDFLRLLLSNDLERSIDLAEYLIETHDEILDVPPVKEEENLTWQEKYALYSGSPGIYHRNLYLTRSIKGVVLYGESLLQDNEKELLALTKKDKQYFDKKISSRLYDVAEAYFKSLELFLKDKQAEAQAKYAETNTDDL